MLLLLAISIASCVQRQAIIEASFHAEYVTLYSCEKSLDVFEEMPLYFESPLDATSYRIEGEQFKCPGATRVLSIYG